MLLLLSLAISDLVTLTVVAPLDIEVFFVRGVLVHGEHLCKILTIILVTSVPSSVWALRRISIECLKNLSDPQNHLCRFPFLTSKRALYSTANDPETANDPQNGPQVIPKVDRK